MKALAKDVDERYQYATELADDLQRFLITSDTIFGRKDLAQYMKSTFAEEVEREKQRMSEYAEMQAARGHAAGGRGGVHGSGGGAAAHLAGGGAERADGDSHHHAHRGDLAGASGLRRRPPAPRRPRRWCRPRLRSCRRAPRPAFRG